MRASSYTTADLVSCPPATLMHLATAAHTKRLRARCIGGRETIATKCVRIVRYGAKNAPYRTIRTMGSVPYFEVSVYRCTALILFCRRRCRIKFTEKVTASVPVLVSVHTYVNDAHWTVYLPLFTGFNSTYGKISKRPSRCPALCPTALYRTMHRTMA